MTGAEKKRMDSRLDDKWDKWIKSGERLTKHEKWLYGHGFYCDSRLNRVDYTAGFNIRNFLPKPMLDEYDRFHSSNLIEPVMCVFFPKDESHPVMTRLHQLKEHLRIIQKKYLNVKLGDGQDELLKWALDNDCENLAKRNGCTKIDGVPDWGLMNYDFGAGTPEEGVRHALGFIYDVVSLAGDGRIEFVDDDVAKQVAIDDAIAKSACFSKEGENVVWLELHGFTPFWLSKSESLMNHYVEGLRRTFSNKGRRLDIKCVNNPWHASYYAYPQENIYTCVRVTCKELRGLAHDKFQYDFDNGMHYADFAVDDDLKTALREAFEFALRITDEAGGDK